MDGASFTMSATDEDVVVQVLRSIDKLILIAINVYAGSYNDVLCTIGIGTHWYFDKYNIQSLSIDVPEDLGSLSRILEVT